MTTLNQFYERIAEDSKQVIIHLMSEPGHGKTSSIRSVIAYIKEKYPMIQFKIFDVSQAWFHCAPTEHRQLITENSLMDKSWGNIGDCVYEIGALRKDYKRYFVGKIMKQDWDHRYQAKLNGVLDRLPYIIYVFEESDIYFGSYALRRNDDFTPVFRNFVSVGRNYRMRGFLISTAEKGEISPSIRRRSRKIYGKLEAEGDLANIRRKDEEVAAYLKDAPKYHFIYYSGGAIGPVRVPDSVVHTPRDYVVESVVVDEDTRVGEGSVKREPNMYLRGVFHTLFALAGVLLGLYFIMLWMMSL